MDFFDKLMRKFYKKEFKSLILMIYSDIDDIPSLFRSLS